MKPILTHPFELKGSRAKRRNLCKRCGHTNRHRIHRHLYPPGSIERAAADERGRMAGDIAKRLGKTSPFLRLLQDLIPTNKEVTQAILERRDEVLTYCPKCGELRKSLPSFNEPMKCHRCGSFFMPNPCGELCHTKQTPAGPVLMRGREEVAKIVMSPEVSQRLTEAAQEEASTGAKRSSLYPKGAQFPARYDLMWRNAAGMRRLAEAWGEGFNKYGADNWFKGFAESVLISHTLEHIRLYLAGDKTEDHLGHCSWNILALCWIEENKPELLDLTKPEQKS